MNSNSLSEGNGDFDGLGKAVDELLQSGKLRTVRSSGQEEHTEENQNRNHEMHERLDAEEHRC